MLVLVLVQTAAAEEAAEGAPPPDLRVAYEPAEGLLRANERLRVALKVSPTRAGALSRVARCQITHGPTLSVPIHCRAAGPVSHVPAR